MRIKHVYLTVILSGLLGLLSQQTMAQSFNEQLAAEYMKTGAYEKAQTLYEELFDSQPNLKNLQNLLHCYVLQSDYKSGEKLLKKLIRKGGNLISYRIELMLLYRASGDDKSYQETFNEIKEEVEKNPATGPSIGQAFVKQQLLQEALEVYLISKPNKPNASYFLQLADIYASLQDQSAFYNCYLELVKYFPQYLSTAKNRLSRAVSKDADDPNNSLLRELLLERLQKEANPDYSNLLIWLFIQEKNFELAFEQLKALDRRLDGDKKELFQLAAIARRNQAFDVATDCYEFIIEKGKTSPYYSNSRVELLATQFEKFQAGLLDEKAIQNLDEAYAKELEQMGKSVEGIELIHDWAYLKGFAMNQAPEGIALLQEALSSETIQARQAAKLKILLGDLLVFENQIWDAVLYYGQAEKAFAADVLGQEAKFRKAKVYYYAGDFGWAQGQLDVLKGSTSKLIANDAMKLSLLINDNSALDSNYTALELYAHADLLFYQNRFEEAHQQLEILRASQPYHPLNDESWYLSYRCLYQLDRKQEAAEALEQIVGMHGNDLLGDEALFHLGEIYANDFGDKERAKHYFEQLILLFPGSTYTQTARTKYRNLRGDQLN